MASRYASPRMPRAPHPTPSSIRAKFRAPIHNPYDKFPREEFDAWIGDLTSRIRRVLAHEEPITNRLAPMGGVSDTLLFDSEEVMEDSFAEVKARRAAKGKERAEQPNDADDEEFVESIIFPANDDYDDEDTEETSEEEMAEYEAESLSEDVDRGVQQGLPEMIEISSDEDEAPVRGSSLAMRWKGKRTFERNSTESTKIPRRVEYGLADDDETQSVNDEADEESAHRSSEQPSPVPEPWTNPISHTNDFYTESRLREAIPWAHNTDILSGGEDGSQVDELEEDSPFTDTLEQAVELPDPWSGPHTYAQDFYSGGDIRGDPSNLSSSNQTPMLLNPQDEDGVGMILTPGVISITPSPAASPPIVYDANEEADEHNKQSGVTRWERRNEEISNEVPTFSMPASGEDESQQSSHEGLPEPSGADGPLSAETLGLREENTVRCPQFHERSVSPPRVPMAGHVNWNFPPAFLGGRATTTSGHLEFPLRPVQAVHTASSPEILEISDDEDEIELPPVKAASQEEQSTAQTVEANEHEGRLEHKGDLDALATSSTISHDAIFAVDPEDPNAYDYGDFEAMYLAQGFHELGQNVSASREEHFEPVSALDPDFGDLPPTGSGLTDEHLAYMPTDAELMDALDQLNRSGARDVTQPPQDSAGHGIQQPIIDIVSAPDAPVDEHAGHTEDSNVTAENNVEEPMRRRHLTTPLLGSAIADVEVQIIEVDSDSEQEGDATSLSAEIDIQTDYGDEPVLDAIYEVESVVTGGRSTVEPGDVSVRSTPGLTANEPHEAASSEPLTQHVSHIDDPLEPRLVLPADIGLLSRDFKPLTANVDKKMAQPIASQEVTHDDGRVISASPSRSSSRMEERFPPIQITISEDRILEPSTSQLSAGTIAASASSQASILLPLFENGIPMPVAADPSVPDPASIHSTPVSPVSPASPLSPADDDATGGRARSPGSEYRAGIRSAIPPALFKHLSGHKSFSGLFTPMSEADTSPSGSVHNSAPSDDGQPQAPGTPADEYVQEGPSTVVKVSAVTEAASTAPDQSFRIVSAQDASRSSDNEISSNQERLEAVEHISARSLTTAEPMSAETSEEPSGQAPEANAGGLDQDAEGEVDLDYTADTDIESSRASEVSSPAQIEEATQEPKANDFTVLTGSGNVVDKASNNSQEPVTEVGDGEEKQVEPAPAASIEEAPVNEELDVSTDKVDITAIPPALKEQRTTEETATSGSARISQPSNPQYNVHREDEPLPINKELGDARPQRERSPESIMHRDEVPDDSISRSETILAGESRPQKRKRRELTPGPVRMTRSMSARGTGLGSASSVKPSFKDVKGKQKAVEPPSEEDESEHEHLSSISQNKASSVGTPSDPQSFSRASSIASSILTNVDIPSSPIVEAPPAVPSIAHFELTNGIMHHRHGRSQLVSEPSRQEQKPQIGPADAAPEVAPRAETDEVEESAVQEASPTRELTPILPATSSPVTRSNCRFHKISLPANENGPRVFFAIPGCSLTDKDLMEEEQIEDHGDAVVESESQLVRDIGTLEIYNSYLEGVLRQLAGVDLLREHAIYYLIQPGEVPRYKPIKSKRRARDSLGGYDPLSQASTRLSVRHRRKERTPGAPALSTTGSVERRYKSSQARASASASISEDESDGGSLRPKMKRRRAGATSELATAAPEKDSNAERGISQAVAERPRARRSRRLGADASAYKPESAEESNSDDSQRQKRRLRSKKRPRADEDDEGDKEKVEKIARAKRRKVVVPSAGVSDNRDEKPAA